ncbi:VanZ family protein [Virgibacillus sp. 179-BFC.A HS]|uniref:VanZ family protein n=1 Tax=Tigheibacillus jepli TaxID=3035914 RepID=A0ABU5CFJ2_9BACI|nr:VanZ family protein [Virgibacillus sp. 179-BFC.A HS]MDY0404609.1 VanZ family protein [Virgibacillus sp. 179-BFC.A HS]
MKKYIAWAPVVIWMGVIFYLSHQSGSESNGLSSGIAATVAAICEKIIPNFSLTAEDLRFWVRKAAHFSAYFLLGVLTCNALRNSRVFGLTGAGCAWAISILYAATDEFHQLFIPGRSGEIRDVLIDSTGALVGILLLTVIIKMYRSRA